MNKMTMALIGGLVFLAMGSEVGAEPASPRTASAGSLSATAPAADEHVLPPVRSRQASGMIVGVDREAKTVTIKARSGERTFALSPRVQIKLGKVKAGFEDIRTGKQVFIRYRDVDGTSLATTVKML